MRPTTTASGCFFQEQLSKTWISPGLSEEPLPQISPAPGRTSPGQDWRKPPFPSAGCQRLPIWAECPRKPFSAPRTAQGLLLQEYMMVCLKINRKPCRKSAESCFPEELRAGEQSALSQVSRPPTPLGGTAPACPVSEAALPSGLTWVQPLRSQG